MAPFDFFKPDLNRIANGGVPKPNDMQTLAKAILELKKEGNGLLGLIEKNK